MRSRKLSKISWNTPPAKKRLIVKKQDRERRIRILRKKVGLLRLRRKYLAITLAALMQPAKVLSLADAATSSARGLFLFTSAARAGLTCATLFLRVQRYFFTRARPGVDAFLRCKNSGFMRYPFFCAFVNSEQNDRLGIFRDSGKMMDDWEKMVHARILKSR